MRHYPPSSLSAGERKHRSRLTQIVSGQHFFRGTLARCGKLNCHCAHDELNLSLYVVQSRGPRVHGFSAATHIPAAVFLKPSLVRSCGFCSIRSPSEDEVATVLRLLVWCPQRFFTFGDFLHSHLWGCRPNGSSRILVMVLNVIVNSSGQGTHIGEHSTAQPFISNLLEPAFYHN